MEEILAIELDDASHRAPSVQKRDADKDAILREAGVPLLRVQVARSYDPGALRNSIEDAIRRV